MHEQTWPVKRIAQLSLQLLPVIDIPEFIAHGTIRLVEILPPGEAEYRLTEWLALEILHHPKVFHVVSLQEGCRLERKMNTLGAVLNLDSDSVVLPSLLLNVKLTEPHYAIAHDSLN